MRIKVDFDFILKDSMFLNDLVLSAIDKNDFYEFLKSIATDTFHLSQQLVPVATGKLKKSGNLRSEGFNFIIEYNTRYAGYVHEIIGNKHKPPTQAKFLQEAFVQVMYNLISTYGEKNIPDFDVRMDISIEEGIKLIIMGGNDGSRLKGVSWRRFLGL